jgi:hypothetical protein
LANKDKNNKFFIHMLSLDLDHLPESLLKKTEFKQVKYLIKCLRNKNDHPPVLIAPPIYYSGSEPHNSSLNVCKYVSNSPNFSTVKGFKIWKVCDKNWITACFHCVIKDIQGNYIDVTPADVGDEAQPMIFVPSSRVYPEFDVQVIAHMTKSGWEPRTGLVACPFEWYNIKSKIDAELDTRILSQCADDLTLWLVPFISKIPNTISFVSFIDNGARIYPEVPDRFIISASGFVKACNKP